MVAAATHAVCLFLLVCRTFAHKHEWTKQCSSSLPTSSRRGGPLAAFIAPTRTLRRAPARNGEGAIALPFRSDENPLRSKFYLNKIHPRNPKSSSLRYTPKDSLVAGIAEIGIGCALGVLMSEYYVITTGCGPLDFPDWLERVCYQCDILVACLTVFNRIVTTSLVGGIGNDLAMTIEEYWVDDLEDVTIWQVKAAEYLSLISVLGAFIALAMQTASGAKMDGLSGIDIELCRAIRDL